MISKSEVIRIFPWFARKRVCTLPETKAGIENLHSGKCRLSSFSPVAMRFCKTHEVLMLFEYLYAGKT